MSKEELLQKISVLESKFEGLSKRQINIIDNVFEDYADSDFFGTERQCDPRGDGRVVMDDWFDQFSRNDDDDFVDDDGNVIEDFNGEWARIYGPESLKDCFNVMKYEIKCLDDEDDLIEGYTNLINDIEEALTNEQI